MAGTPVPDSSTEDGTEVVSSGVRFAYWKGLIKAFAIEWALLCVLALIVALLMNLFRHTDTVQSLDRGTSDLIMRRLARETLAGPASNRFVFVDIGEASCHLWAQKLNEPCSAGFSTPRGELADLVSSLLSANSGRKAMRLVLLDIELAPQPAGANDADQQLCGQVYMLANRVPVVAVRPSIPEAVGTARPIVRAYPSILDGSACGAAVASHAPPNLWFGSPLLSPDTDNVIRSVYKWNMVQTIKPEPEQRLAGMGLLGAALLDGRVDPGVLACLFPASHAKPEACPNGGLTIGGHTYEPGTDEADAKARIVFSLPWGGGIPNAQSFGYAPYALQIVEAAELRQRLQENPSLIDGATVIIGGSYLASGDVRSVPLESRMPGAMIHANAVRAFTDGLLVEEHDGWGWELILIGIASVIGAVCHIAGHRLAGRVGKPLDHVLNISFAMASIVLTVIVIFSIGTWHAFSSLSQSGIAIGVLSPVLAVTIEGMSSVLHAIREAITEALLWAQRSLVPGQGGHDGH